MRYSISTKFWLLNPNFVVIWSSFLSFLRNELFYFWHKISIIGNYEKCDFRFKLLNFMKFSSSLKSFLVFLSELPVFLGFFYFHKNYSSNFMKFSSSLKCSLLVFSELQVFFLSRIYSDAKAPFSTFKKIYHRIFIKISLPSSALMILDSRKSYRFSSSLSDPAAFTIFEIVK